MKPVFFNKSFCYFWKVKKETSETCSNFFFFERGGVGGGVGSEGWCHSTKMWLLLLLFNKLMLITILSLHVNWEKLGPHLSFTFENKTGNLHEVRLPTF